MGSMTPAVVLLTDFGLSDPFVGVMKGVLAAGAPRTPVIDLTHGVAPQDVRGAALALKQATPYFPGGTLFVCVVDPGVGSSRRVLWARGERHEYLAPDNGLLAWAEKGRFREVRSVENEALFLKPVSRTFHGRDVFAPVAAALACGLDPAELGPKVAAIKRLPFPPTRRERAGVRGEILAFDRFGNAITNLTPRDLPRGARVSHRGSDVGPLRTHYGAVPAGRALALTGSSGYVELAVRDGDFAKLAGAAAGDLVEARR